MVDSGDQAAALVAATGFPPLGVRGVSSATSRASGFGADPDYLATAHRNDVIIAQIESKAGLAAIAATEGIDALFIGPADLAASLGHLGNPGHPEVQAAIASALSCVRANGKPASIFALSETDAREKIAQGFKFVSLGTDIGLLTQGATRLKAAFTGDRLP